MSAILDAFKVQPFDLEPIFQSWTPPPTFTGSPQKDPPVDEWLETIRKGCEERKVPRAYWHKVGYHFMGTQARGRMDEVKQVMRNMHGGKYTWNWKSYKVAMRNMGWDIDPATLEEFVVESKPSGFWSIIPRRKKTSDAAKEKEKAKDDDASSIHSQSSTSTPERPTPKKSRTTWDVSTLKRFPLPRRSATMSHIETVTAEPSSLPPPPPPKSKPKSKETKPTDGVVTTPAVKPTEPPANPANAVTTVTQAPLWLVNACQALDFITTEHPKVMTALSAVLITVGSIPALPAITAGAGGVFLASGTAHAIGTIAVGLGTLLKAASDGQVHTQPGQPSSEVVKK